MRFTKHAIARLTERYPTLEVDRTVLTDISTRIREKRFSKVQRNLSENQLNRGHREQIVVPYKGLQIGLIVDPVSRNIITTIPERNANAS